MQFKEGTHVYNSNDNDVGTIDRVVLDPSTDKITHIVVRKGWLFIEDKVVPIDLIDTAVQDQVRLRADVQNLDDLPTFEETQFVPPGEGAMATYPSEQAAPLYWYPPVGAAWAGYYTGYYGYPPAPYVAYTEQNIPEGTVGLKEGADVISADGEHVGTIERIYTNTELNRATHLLITEGWLFTEKRLIPVDWISTVGEEEVRLAMSAHNLEQVPEFQGEPA